MKSAAFRPHEVTPTAGGPDRVRRRARAPLRAPVRYWVRLGERLFHYRLLRAQMLERAFMPADRTGDSR
jgi:hypothetical protein